MPKHKQKEEISGIIYPSKNKNEYRLDGKTYILDVKKSFCREIDGDVYILHCSIHQRGKHEYTYIKGSDYIVKQSCDRKLYLTEKARQKIDKTIEKTDALFDEMRGPKYRQVSVPELGMLICYRSIFRGVYDFLISVCYKQDLKHISVYNSVSVSTMLQKIYFDSRARLQTDAQKRRLSFLFESNENTIGENPLYRSAAEHDDMALKSLIKTYYRIADEKECAFLSRLFGIRTLPTLLKEFDKDYYVDSDTIKLRILDHSGYRVLHRPYFSMSGSTHSVWTLNPHKKSGVDAAPIDTETITFNEFLELFDEPKV